MFKTGTYKYEHITPSLKALKWLPVTKEVYLREAVVAFKCINGFAPPYLCQGAVQGNQTIFRYQNAELQQDRDHSPIVPSI